MNESTNVTNTIGIRLSACECAYVCVCSVHVSNVNEMKQKNGQAEKCLSKNLFANLFDFDQTPQSCHRNKFCMTF